MRSEPAELIVRSHLPETAEEVFAWHARPGAFERLVPPWERIVVRERRGTIHDGDYVILEIGRAPFSHRWAAVHSAYVEGRQFADEQVDGPFAHYRHTHKMEPDVEGSWLEDKIEYALPLGLLGRLAAGGRVRRRLERTFAYRHRVIAGDLARHHGMRPMRVAVSGASGLIGRALTAFLTSGGHEVVRLVRKPSGGPGEIQWDPQAGRIDEGRLDGVDAVVHLAGESLAAGRWSEPRKRRILESRVGGTRLIAEALARLGRRPRVLVSASAVGFYGARADEVVDETTPPGEGFLAEVCRAWEAATAPAEQAGIRVVHARFGVVLTPAGGALARMLPAFSLGLGGPIGSGRQGLPWVALDDALYAIHCALTDERLSGPVNVVAPEAVSQRELATALGAVLGRPAFLPLPAFVVKLLFGEMGEAALLEGARVRPRRLEEIGFSFRYPTLDAALRHELGKVRAPEPILTGHTVELQLSP